MSIVRRVCLIVVTGVALVVPVVALAPAAQANTRGACNDGSTAIGVVRERNSSHVYGQYDALLYPYKCTSDAPLYYTSFAGFWTGAGYCVDVKTGFGGYEKVIGPRYKWFYSPDNTNYSIAAYHC